MALAAASALLSLMWLAADTRAAAPPAQASPDLGKAAAGGPVAAKPPSPPVTQNPTVYRELAPGLLARTRFSTADAGPIAAEIVDLLVAPHQLAEIRATEFAALLEVEAGSARLSLNGKEVATRLGSVVAVNQGQTIAIDNRRADRTWVARLVKLGGSVK